MYGCSANIGTCERLDVVGDIQEGSKLASFGQRLSLSLAREVGGAYQGTRAVFHGVRD
jgi:hypothetical protein